MTLDQKLHRENKVMENHSLCLSYEKLRSLMKNRSLRLSYEKLRSTNVVRLVLNIHVHRYMAVAKNMRIGCFSTLGMACLEVDNRRQHASNSSWLETCNRTRSESYVMDMVGGKVYERQE
jgi:hypothetical protein